jgi:hypothetical protein
MGNINNTLIYILNPQNINLLYSLNNSYDVSHIRPLYSNNYPLGSIDIDIQGVSNARIKIGHTIYNAGKNTKVDYLPSRQYNIMILDSNNLPLNVSMINGNIWNKDNFDIDIESAQVHKFDRQSSLLESLPKNKPQNNKCNLLINLYPYNTPFEIIGKTITKKFNTGYKLLQNIDPGEYIIKYNNIQNKILAIKNDNNYFTNRL